jgi:hypothetical protein
MILPFGNPPFGVTHPLGLPRPLDPDNFFGAKIAFFANNVMPVPTGCLAHYDAAAYRPYARLLVAALRRIDSRWSGPAYLDDPPRYCLLRGGVPAEVPPELWPLLPDPPRVSLSQILCHFDSWNESAAPMQLLDILTLVAEDLGPAKFAEASSGHPWVAGYMH